MRLAITVVMHNHGNYSRTVSEPVVVTELSQWTCFRVKGEGGGWWGGGVVVTNDLFVSAASAETTVPSASKVEGRQSFSLKELALSDLPGGGGGKKLK